MVSFFSVWVSCLNTNWKCCNNLPAQPQPRPVPVTGGGRAPGLAMAHLYPGQCSQCQTLLTGHNSTAHAHNQWTQEQGFYKISHATLNIHVQLENFMDMNINDEWKCILVILLAHHRGVTSVLLYFELQSVMLFMIWQIIKFSHG